MNEKKICKKCKRLMWYKRADELCRYCLRAERGYKVSNQYIKAKETGISYIIKDTTRKKLSDATKGDKNGFYNKIHSKETIEIIKQKNRDYQDSLTDEKRKEISEKCRLAQKRIRDRDPELYSKMKAKGALATNNNWKNYRKTSIEQKFEKFLIDNNIEYEYSFIIGRYQYDFRIKNTKILIEIHGSYWHGNPLFYESINKIQLAKKLKDEEKKKYAEDNGWILKVFWDVELDDLSKERILK